MAFASSLDRLALANQGDFPSLLAVQIVTRDGREIELAADDVDHALSMSGDWLKRGARSVEVFRVNREDGSLIPTLGPTFG